ncbi:sialate O-acetylesterase [Neptunitalea lumnitzerae]|uniref:9-O-acetylesterase n=1 Tax=Neptunitalea lumnitzerae TaxID=2965509 RepID=A0ABQ5MIW9_9FLAO|nr:sialate O-acetylesterase [Neptunitalea sp. Y10]GLB49354.1 9-O-acetylesterase [Neptunitalea sp. Y10]
MFKKIFILLLFISPLATVKANVVLPSVFSDHMVLQQNTTTKFWGWADPNEELTISPSWTTETYTTKTSNLANWKLEIPTPKAGGPFTIKVKGYNEILLTDVYIGEVWFCSGQSNMEMSAAWGIENGDAEMAAANYPTIRFFKTPKSTSDAPQLDVNAQWEVCTPEVMKYNSAVAYFFAQKLHKELDSIPVGIMVSAWGGTPAEIWIPSEVIKKDETLSMEADKLQPAEWGPIKPAKTFNTMIQPLVGYSIAGFLWYQGESNVGSNHYDETLGALINTWRTLWKNNELPFYLVQIAPFNYENDTYSGVKIRDAQRKLVTKVPNTAMVVISDVSTTDDIHPKNKKPVGERLANIALKNKYKAYEGTISGPLFSNFEIDKNKVIVHFNNNEGLYFSSKENQFEIAGEDGIFYTAKATIKNNSIYLKSKKVKKPTDVRFAWGNTIQSNLFNKAQLPASSFTSK